MTRDDVAALQERLNRSASEFEFPPSVQSQTNIRAINAMHDAVKSLAALQAENERLTKERNEWRDSAFLSDNEAQSGQLEEMTAENERLTKAAEALRKQLKLRH